jgi:hypothetical protein
MEETNGSNCLPQQEKNSRKGKGTCKGWYNQIPHCTLPFSFVTIQTRGVTFSGHNNSQRVITLVGTFKQGLHVKGKGIESTLKY